MTPETPVPIPSPESPSPRSDTAWGVFFSTFVTILLAELGDKTQVTIVLMSAEFKNPFIIFAGAALALISTSLLGVLAGRWLSRYLSPKTLNRSAGIILVTIAAVLFFDVFRFH
ncbi:MAG: TMEM165/GDT1 family protein [Prochlorotrichaceae cyanobacterium]